MSVFVSLLFFFFLALCLRLYQRCRSWFAFFSLTASSRISSACSLSSRTCSSLVQDWHQPVLRLRGW